MVEEFLEDINNMLNSGEVPNLFEKDELEQVLAATRPKAKEAGVSEENRDEVPTDICDVEKASFRCKSAYKYNMCRQVDCMKILGLACSWLVFRCSSILSLACGRSCTSCCV